MKFKKKIQNVKIKKKIPEENCFHQNLQCDGKKLKYIKQQESGGLLSGLEIKTPLNKIPLVGPLLF